MQTSGEINSILQEIASLPPDDQVYIAEILEKRIHQLKREQILSRAEEAEENYRTKKVKKGNAGNLINTIRND